MIATTRIESPLGTLLAAAENEALTGLWFLGQRHFPKDAATWDAQDDAAPFDALRRQLDEYFSGERQAFEVSLDPGGSRATKFQRAVWNAIAAVPFGRTITYSQLASQCGRPTASRAAGAATGRNPVSILIPCHRIVGSSGDLTGYAGGLERKTRLLQLEAVL
jgi:methylated-DNA-[protein]-cysteine S-methyltransferase